MMPYFVGWAICQLLIGVHHQALDRTTSYEAEICSACWGVVWPRVLLCITALTACGMMRLVLGCWRLFVTVSWCQPPSKEDVAEIPRLFHLFSLCIEPKGKWNARISLDLLGYSFSVLFSFPSLFWIWTPIWYQGLWLEWPPSAILTCSGGGGARWWRISWSLLWFFGFKVSACLSVHFQPDLCLVCLWIVVVFRASLWDLWSGVFSDHSMFLGCFVTLFPATLRKARCCGMSMWASFSSLGHDSVGVGISIHLPVNPSKETVHRTTNYCTPLTKYRFSIGSIHHNWGP